MASDPLLPDPPLLVLARKRFATGALSQAEEVLFRVAGDDAVTGVGKQDPTPDSPANAADWPQDRVVRAECVAWLCTNYEASRLVTHQGVHLRSLRIDGELDLDYAKMKFPFRAWRCVFTGRILLQYAELEILSLEACYTKEVQACGVRVVSEVFLRNSLTPEDEPDSAGPFKAEGKITLAGATIGGSLDCRGAYFSNPKEIALNADGARIDGDVFLKDGFTAEGEVTLIGAKIEGNLECDAGKFLGSGKDALSPNSAKIEGNVFLAKGFKAVGAVNLVHATIGGLLEIQKVKDPGEFRVNLRSVKVNTFLDDKESWPKQGNLELDGFRYERLHQDAPVDFKSRKDWLSRQPKRDAFLPQPYEQLATVLRAMGHEGDAKSIMVQKNRERARFTHFPQQAWWWYNFFGWVSGYGYRPLRALALSVGMILLGAILFCGGYSSGLFSPTRDSAYEKDASGQFPRAIEQRKIAADYPVFNPIAYSMESFIPLLKFDQSANWQPNANRATVCGMCEEKVTVSGSVLRWYLWFHIVIGWVLTSLWVGAVTGVVKS
jgi:hypothetical protein